MIKSTGLKQQERCKNATNCWGLVKVGRSGILKVARARARPLDLANTYVCPNSACTMSRQQFAEAVLSNIVYFFNSTKNSQLGNDIASRNFIMHVAFHPRGFTNSGFSYRLSER